MALNLDSVVFVTRAALPLLKKGKNPSVINFTSIAGWNAGGQELEFMELQRQQ